MRYREYNDGRNEIYVNGKVEYVEGKIGVKKLDNGLVMIRGSYEGCGAVAVWKGGGYVVWVWNGKCWRKYVDLRYKYGERFLNVVKELRKGRL